MGSANKIAKGTFWTTISNIINGIYGFVSVPLLIAYYGKSNYGLIGLAMSVNVYLRLMDMGLNSTNVRFFSNWIEKKQLNRVNKLFQSSLSIYGIIGLLNTIILLIVSVFANSIFNVSSEQVIILKQLLYILAISAFFNWMISCLDQLVRANEFVGWSQKVGLIAKMIQVLILVATIIFKFNIQVYFALSTFSYFIVIPFLIWKIRKVSPYIIFRFGFDRDILKEIIPYTLNIFSFGLFQFSINYLRPVLLGIEGSMESITDYRVLNGIVQIVIMIGGAFLGIILPSAAKAVARNDKSAQLKMAYDGTKYITIALCFCCFGVIGVSKELITLYVGDSYLHLVPWLVIWLLTTLSSHNQAISSLILSGSNIRAITFCTIISSIIGLIVCWILIPILDVGGTIIGYGLYCLIQILFYYLYYWPKKMQLDSKKIFVKSFSPAVLVGCVIGFGLYVTPSFHINYWIVMILKGFLFSVLYFIVIWMIVLNNSDKELMKKITNRRTITSVP